MIRVAITDDHPIVVRGLQDVLDPIPDIVVIWTAGSAAETYAQLDQEVPDVLLLDVNLPDVQGTEVCGQVTEKYTGLKVLGLSSFDQSSYVKKMLEKGASGYLLKTVAGTELTKAIVTVHEGRKYMHGPIQEQLVREAMGHTDTETIPKLTRREKEVLALILEECTTSEIAKRLFISQSTAETHRLNLIQKLGVRNTAGLVKIALEHGLMD